MREVYKYYVLRDTTLCFISLWLRLVYHELRSSRRQTPDLVIILRQVSSPFHYHHKNQQQQVTSIRSKQRTNNYRKLLYDNKY